MFSDKPTAIQSNSETLTLGNTQQLQAQNGNDSGGNAKPLAILDHMQAEIVVLQEKVVKLEKRDIKFLDSPVIENTPMMVNIATPLSSDIPTTNKSKLPAE